jgi:hypothetical protein
VPLSDWLIICQGIGKLCGVTRKYGRGCVLPQRGKFASGVVPFSNHPFLLPRITNPTPAATATAPNTGTEIVLRLSPLALKSLSRSVSAVRPDANAMTPAIISTIPTMTVGFMMLNSPSELPSFRLGCDFKVVYVHHRPKPA